jgi:hypothetical protein
LPNQILIGETLEGSLALQRKTGSPVATIKKTEKRKKLLDANGDRGFGEGLVRMEPFQNFA